VRPATRLLPVALALTILVGAAACSGDDDDDASPNGTTSTTLATGGITVQAPDGWQEIPLPQLGIGLAVPPKWEALVLSADGLASLAQANPAVPGFADAAHAAAAAGAVFYAAGVAQDDRVTDLKVRAIPDSGVKDVADLEESAHQLAAEAKLENPTIEPVAGAERPTVRVRFHTEASRADPDDPQADPTTVPVEGTEYLVLGPKDTVYSLIVTSEQAEGHDALAQQIFDTVAFPKA
jgi:hypothetical protein